MHLQSRGGRCWQKINISVFLEDFLDNNNHGILWQTIGNVLKCPWEHLGFSVMLCSKRELTFDFLGLSTIAVPCCIKLICQIVVPQNHWKVLKTKPIQLVHLVAIPPVRGGICGFTFCHCFGIFVHRTEEGGCSRTEEAGMRQNTQRRQASRSLCRPGQIRAAGTLGSWQDV